MTKETFMSVFDQVESLYAKDVHLDEVEWEVIGGETTMMPYEWWEEMLPYALKRISELNERLKIKGSLNFLTNLVYSDKRYTDLLSQYSDHPYFSLYTSWEPDTNRFGKRHQLFPKFLQTMSEIKGKKTLDIILTKEVIRMGPQYVLDTFLPLGVNDFSIKQLSPYGSGKEFFKTNMVSFKEMCDYLLEFGRLKPKEVTYTPQDEMMSSLHRGTSFQCNGNFRFDISIEPNGLTTFNANQTADEASVGLSPLYITDPFWANKAMYENTRELDDKLTLSHPSCDGCEYITYCNAGWYHYKVINPAEIADYNKDECPGFKGMWDDVKIKVNAKDLSISKSFLRWVASGRIEIKKGMTQVNESSLPKEYDAYLAALSKGDFFINLDQKEDLFGRSLSERLWFYDSLGIISSLFEDVIMSLDPAEAEKILTHAFNQDYTYIKVTKKASYLWLNKHSESKLVKSLSKISLVLIQDGLSKITRPYDYDMALTLISSGLSPLKISNIPANESSEITLNRLVKSYYLSRSTNRATRVN